MNHSKPKTRCLTSQQDALTEYLEALLKEVGFGDELPLVETAPELSLTESAISEAGLTELENIEPVVEPEEVREVQIITETDESVAPVVSLQYSVEENVEEPATSCGNGKEENQILNVQENEFSFAHESIQHNGALSEEIEVDDNAVSIPEWATGRFQCLTFDVGGMKIAAPLEKLNGIIEWPENITILPGHADWFIGLHRTRGQNVQVIDLAMILRAQSVMEEEQVTVGERAKYIMLIDDGGIGLASDTVANMLTLVSDDVKWRKSGGKAPIFAGTVIDNMCSVLDVESLITHIRDS